MVHIYVFEVEPCLIYVFEVELYVICYHSPICASVLISPTMSVLILSH